MKVLAIVLLCAFAAVQGRTALKVQATEAAKGEYPYRVHLRIAVSTTGLLHTCGGSLLGGTYILTTASCVEDLRFVWIRYGALNIIHPDLVTEASQNISHPSADIALIRIGRILQDKENIASIPFVGGAVQNVGVFASYGENNGVPGEVLSGCELTRASEEDSDLIAYEGDVIFSSFDVGAPLVNDGIQFAIFAAANSKNAGDFLPLAPFVDWLEQETGLILAVPEQSGSRMEEENPLKVKVANM